MENTVARFEFRIFGKEFPDIEKKIENLFQSTQIKESSEIYILSSNTNTNNCKIRYDLLDIKQLISKHSDLEQWIPKIKVSFPISSDIIRLEIFKYLLTKVPDLHYNDYSLDLFIKEIVKPHPDLNIAYVDKSRKGFEKDNCMLEIAKIRVNGKEQTTIGIESPEVWLIEENRKMLGLDTFPNENYVQALKRITGN